MTENQMLLAWMQQQNISNSELAAQMGISYDLVYKLVTGQREVTDSFKWRFAQVFGYEEADRLFGSAEAVTEVTPISQ